MVNSVTVMAWKVKDNKTSAVEEARSMSTVVGANGCVVYPPLLYCIKRQEWVRLAILCRQRGKIVAQLVRHISRPPRFRG